VNFGNFLLHDAVVEIRYITTGPRHSLYCTLVNAYMQLTHSEINYDTDETHSLPVLSTIDAKYHADIIKAFKVQ